MFDWLMRSEWRFGMYSVSRAVLGVTDAAVLSWLRCKVLATVVRYSTDRARIFGHAYGPNLCA
jgi:hypothetical protein